MANPLHIEWLQEGVEAWNRRREQISFHPDFAGAVFTDEMESLKESNGRIDLNGINLDDADLSMANLKYVTLQRSELNHADLSKANLSFVNLEYAKCIRAKFIAADLAEATLDHAECGSADFRKADLRFCNMSGTDFHTANLAGANLAVSKLWQAKIFSESDRAHHYMSELENSKKKISSVSEFLEVFKDIKNSYENSRLEDTVFYFRGHTRESWALCPSVMRTEVLREAEGNMLLDIMAQQPSAFKGLDSALAEWVLAQHHGLKTRLLDVTRNPLVALFYACGEENRNKQDAEDAHMHIFATHKSLIKTFRSDAISVIANFAKLNQGEKNVLVGIPGQNFPYPEVLGRLYHLIRHEKPYFQEGINPIDFFRVFVIEPQQSFDRIRVQSGAFLISGFHARFEREEILRWNRDTPVYDHYILTIPHTCKKSMRDELRLLSIARETLFPGLDEAAHSIIQRYST